MRVLIAVTHLLGAGHLTRAAALARAFAGAGHAVTLVSGGMPAPLVRLDRVRLVQLPPLRVMGTAFSRLLDAEERPAGADLLDRRRRLLLDALEAAEPDAVVTELFPFGRRALAAEFLALAEAARARGALLVASLRDVLVPPDRPEKVGEAHARAALYDAILVHGDPDLVPLDASWPLDAPTRARIRYTGYVDGDAGADGPGAAPAPARSGVVVAAGSGPAGLDLCRAAAGAARRRPDLGWRILVGHGVSEPAFGALAGGLPAGTVARARPDYRTFLAHAALSVSPCGYNTALDLLASGVPALLVPFEAGGETEQRLRAERLAARGLARVLPEADLSADALLAAVADALAAGPGLPDPAGAAIDRGGAARSVALVAGLHRERTRRAGPEPFGLAALRAALDGAASDGRHLPVWWRDDDATAATPALDRLLGLADAHGAPLLIAAIPARCDASLARRVAREPGISLAVHGLAHADHAPAGEKAAEFGPHRPRPALRADAAAALRLARDRLPAGALLPVFVPPWNRIASDLAPALPGLGYRGLSAAGGPPVPGLARADADLDPIDWRGTRSLRDPAGLIAALGRFVAAPPARPVGLLTHHLAHDAAVWAFLEALLALLARHPAVRLVDPRDLFGGAVDAGARAPYATTPATPARARIG